MDGTGVAQGLRVRMRRIAALETVAAVALAAFAIAISGVPSAAAVECQPVPHAPILIRSDADFTAANGVASGSGTAGSPYLFANLAISDLSRGYAFKVDNSKGKVTKSFAVQCLKADFSAAPPSGAKVVWIVNVHRATTIAWVIANAGEAAGSVGVQLDGSSNILLDSLSINKFGHDGIQINGSDHVTVIRSKSKAMGNGLFIRDSHDITVGQTCNLSSGQDCNEFTYDDEFGVRVLNSYNVVIQYLMADANDTGGILLDGAGTYNVQLYNGHASGTGNICPSEGGTKQPSGLIVDYVAGFAIINGAHDVLMRGWTIQGNSHFSIENGGDGMFLNPCTGLFERLPGKTTPGGGPNLDVNGNCWYNEFGFDPVPTEDCPGGS